MTFYELTTLTVGLGSQPRAISAIDSWMKDGETRGRLLGCWLCEIGALNRIVILRDFETEADRSRERQRALLSAGPFGCADMLTGLTIESYLPFPDLPQPQPGSYGPVYEIRTYVLKPGGLPAALENWTAAMPARTELSPQLLAMYAENGTPRFVHIWPYPDLATRGRIRSESVKRGIWPPKNGAAWLSTDMQSAIYLPTAISPLN